LYTVQGYTALTDRFLRSLFRAVGFSEGVKEIKEERLALLAMGSYGRRELCLGSDVDLMVVHRGPLSSKGKEVILHGLYPLWDANLEVGYSIMTIQECIRLAMDDFSALTSLMDARFLLGSKPFYGQFQVAFRSRVQREKKSLLNQFLINRQKREDKYASQGCFVEPNIKEGLGGLRDLHFMVWMARTYFKSETLSQIKRLSTFSHFGTHKLSYSKSFLLKVRNHLHLLNDGRKVDVLLLPFQKKIAYSLRYENRPHETGTERFMRSLYLHLNRIRYGSEEFYTKALDIIDPRPEEHALPHLPQELHFRNGNIEVKTEGLLHQNPLLILRAFNEANQKGFFLGSGLIWATGNIIASKGKELHLDPEAKRLFLQIILNPRNTKVLRLALDIGLISLFIPEFKKIRNLAQFSYYHHETVDIHSVKTLEVIHEISTGAFDDRWALFREVYQELENPDVLFIAGLLHDIGKKCRGNHAEEGAGLIPRILTRLNIAGESIRVVSFLVKHHLLLVRISQKRDLNDEKTSVQAAQTIQSIEALNLLFLLTIADSFATGPIAHSDWKIILIIELFFKVRRILKGGTLASPDATKRLSQKRKLLSKRLERDFQKEAVSNLMDQVSSRYLLNTPAQDMIHHFQLALNMGREKRVWRLQKLKFAPVTRVISCTYDRAGLFSKIVGVFALNNIKVLSANIFPLKNGLVFDVYEVTNPLDPLREENVWKKIQNDALEAIENRMPLGDLITRKERKVFSLGEYPVYRPKKIDIDNDASDFFTILEVSSADRIGLLYELAEEVFSLGLDIRYAKVNSDKERMSGVFYVIDSGGQKALDENLISRMRQKIISVIR
jgi:[protein-PII] uridylyltransferase